MALRNKTGRHSLLRNGMLDEQVERRFSGQCPEVRYLETSFSAVLTVLSGGQKALRKLNYKFSVASCVAEDANSHLPAMHSIPASTVANHLGLCVPSPQVPTAPAQSILREGVFGVEAGKG